MELFTLGADRGYSERDVREQARALTGLRNDWDDGVGPHAFRFDAKLHDGGTKRSSASAATSTGATACRLCVRHPHAPVVFVTSCGRTSSLRAAARTARARARSTCSGGSQIRPLLEAILMHPQLYEGPRMVKPPAVYVAGHAAGARRGDRHRLLDLDRPSDRPAALPPAERRRLGRPALARHGDVPGPLDRGDQRAARGADRHRPALSRGRGALPKPSAKALAFLGGPDARAGDARGLERFASAPQTRDRADWEQKTAPRLRQNALRMLIATSPDLQTC